MTVRRGTLVAGGVSIVALLVTVAFLVGRESARSGAVAPAAERVAALPRAPEERERARPGEEGTRPVELDGARARLEAPGPAEATPSGHATDLVEPTSATRPLPATEPTREAPQPTPATTAVKGEGPTAEAVRVYLAKMDAIQADAQGGASPQAFAQQLVAEALSGDGSGFVRLARTLGDAEVKVRAIEPPEPCREHHAAMVATLAQSKALVTRLERAIAAKDADALAAISGSSTELQHATDALQRAESALRERYGAPPRRE